MTLPPPFRMSIITLGVADLNRSLAFYQALGCQTTWSPDKGVIFFQTPGVSLALYPVNDLANDVEKGLAPQRAGFPGFSIAHNTRSRAEVDAVMARAVAAGARIEKPAQDTFWGGYAGYFSDPDGWLWEVAHGDMWQFNPDGSLTIP